MVQTEVQLILGQVYATQQRYDEAIAVYDQAIKANNQDFRPVLAKASILKQQGKTEQAKALFENAAALAPTQYKEEINRLATEEPAVNKRAGGAEGTGRE
jgi:tetratricopeptide (TPR) repeat protein